MKISTKNLATIGTCALSVGLIVVAASSWTQNSLSDRGPDDSPAATIAATTSPLDAIPGFGKSPSTVLRDDAIALWEAHQRELLTAECMAEAGFDYSLEPLAGTEQRRKVARYLGIEGEVAEALRPGARPSIDAYWQALYGITAKEASQGLGNPENGCVGESWRKLPGIWQLKRKLADPQAAIAHEVNASPLIAEAESAFEECADDLGISMVSSPAELDQSIAERTAPESARKVLAECTTRYQEIKTKAVVREEAAFVEAHPELQAQRTKYSDAPSRMRSDRDFVDFLLEGSAH